MWYLVILVAISILLDISICDSETMRHLAKSRILLILLTKNSHFHCIQNIIYTFKTISEFSTVNSVNTKNATKLAIDMVFKTVK